MPTKKEPRSHVAHVSSDIVGSVPLIHELVAMWDEKVDDVTKRFVPVTLAEIKAYIRQCRERLGYDPDTYAGYTTGAPPAGIVIPPMPQPATLPDVKWTAIGAPMASPYAAKPDGMPIVTPGGFPMPPGGFPMPPGGFPMPPGGFPMPPGGFPKPLGGFPMPLGGFPMPPGGFPMPPGGFPMPPGGGGGGTSPTTSTTPPGEGFACPKCPKTFRFEAALASHMVLKHS